MHGIAFALEAFIAGMALLDWMYFGGNITSSFMRFVGA
jgi:hypothetical protein